MCRMMLRASDCYSAKAECVPECAPEGQVMRTRVLLKVSRKSNMP